MSGAPAFDYKKMLMAYIVEVGTTEGADFLGDGPSAGVDGLTEDENVEMAKLRDQVRDWGVPFYDKSGRPLAP